MTNDSTTNIGKFVREDGLHLESVENGGWIIHAGGRSMGEVNKPIGAYSNTDDMLSALNASLR